MFDLILDKIPRPYRRSARGAIVVSACGHAVLGTAIVVLSLMYGMGSLPKVPLLMPTMMAFATTSPPPPPPPPPLRRQPAAEVQPSEAASSSNPNAAPIEAPTGLEPEGLAPPSDGGEPSGVEGGIEGGVVGGIVGGLVAEVAPPPPPPPAPPPAPRQPVRIGGQVSAPALVHRVEPDYPRIARDAHLEGTVILAATVDVEGRVGDVKVLRSRGVILDQAAIEAVQQWRYEPLLLNGVPTPWLLTATLNFVIKVGEG